MNNPALMCGGGLGPLNPFTSLNGAVMPGLTPILPPNLTLSGGATKSPFATPSPSPSSAPSATPNTGQRKSAFPPSPSQHGGVRMQPVLPTQKSRRNGGDKKKTKKRGTKANTNTATQTASNTAGIMHRVLPNEHNTNHGNKKSPPLSTVPILPAPPSKADLVSKLNMPGQATNGTSGVNENEDGNSITNKTPVATSMPSPTATALSRELPLEIATVDCKHLTIPFAPNKATAQENPP